MAKRKAKVAAPNASEGTASQLTFEQSFEDLEAVVRELEDGQLDMDSALSAYEQGLARLKRCYHLLQSAQRKVEILSGVDEEGNPVTEPFPGSEEDN